MCESSDKCEPAITLFTFSVPMATRLEHRRFVHPKLDNHFDYRATMARLILGIPELLVLGKTSVLDF